MHKVLENVLNLPEIQKYFGEQLKNISYSVEPAGPITADSVITLNSMDQSGKVTTKKGTLSDFDLRELMKLLISTFGELRTADRERALNILTAVVAAIETKISAMEKERDAQFTAAVKQAVGQIVGGIATGACGIIGGGLNFAGPKQVTGPGFKHNQGGAKVGTTETKLTRSGIAADMISGSAMPLGKIIEGSANIESAKSQVEATNARIEQTQADATIEVLKQAQEQYTKGNDSLQQFIDKVLNIMQQLLQSAAQTEKSVANI
ncbi:MAG: hypothetical protein ACLRFH_01815 [Opitutales bacterium]